MSAPPAPIRPVTEGDAEQLWPLAAALATSYTPTRAGFDRALHGIIADAQATILVAPSVSGVDGYVHVLTHDAFHADGRIGWVEELYVRPESRGSGLGRSLMAAAETWAREQADVVYLAVATRRAEDFYLAAGYERSATYFTKQMR